MSIVGHDDDRPGFQNEPLRIVKCEIRRASEERACVQPHDHWSGYGRQGIPHPDVQLETVFVACEDRTGKPNRWTVGLYVGVQDRPGRGWLWRFPSQLAERRCRVWNPGEDTRVPDVDALHRTVQGRHEARGALRVCGPGCCD